MKRKKPVCIVLIVLIVVITSKSVLADELSPNEKIINTEHITEPEEAFGLNFYSANTVKTYSKSQNGETYLSNNFKVREFACNDGSDTILIDPELVTILQNIRDYFGKPVIISSAYRTITYNNKIGGSSGSYHTKGMAADIYISGVTSLEMAKYAETIGVRGIGWYYSSNNFIHVDTRPTKYYWKNSDGSTNVTVTTHGGAYNSKPYAHTHSYSKGIEAAHPHREYMKCSCGDYYYTGNTGSINTCSQCTTPGKPSLLNMMPLYNTESNVKFEWNATVNTTHYNLYISKMDANGEYKYYENVFYAESGLTRKLESGRYNVILQSTNSNARRL